MQSPDVQAGGVVKKAGNKDEWIETEKERGAITSVSINKSASLCVYIFFSKDLRPTSDKAGWVTKG